MKATLDEGIAVGICGRRGDGVLEGGWLFGSDVSVEPCARARGEVPVVGRVGGGTWDVLVTRKEGRGREEDESEGRIEAGRI